MLKTRRHRRGYPALLLPLLNFLLWQIERSTAPVIDDRLTVLVNECYARISIGSKVREAEIGSWVEADRLSRCKETCSKMENKCRAFAFGLDPRGNGSCAITAQIPTIEKLLPHPDYDVYVKKWQVSPISCSSDHLYENGKFVRTEEGNVTKRTFPPITPEVIVSSGIVFASSRAHDTHDAHRKKEPSSTDQPFGMLETLRAKSRERYADLFRDSGYLEYSLYDEYRLKDDRKWSESEPTFFPGTKPLIPGEFFHSFPVRSFYTTYTTYSTDPTPLFDEFNQPISLARRSSTSHFRESEKTWKTRNQTVAR